MVDVVPLFRQGAGLVGLEDDFAAIEAIVAMFDKWQAPATRPRDFAEVWDLLDAVAASVNDPKVVDAFTTLGLEDAVRGRVSKLLGKVTAAGAKIPDWARDLLTRMDKFTDAHPGTIAWNPLDEKATLPIEDAHKVVLGFSGKAGIGLAARTSWPGDEAKAPLLRLDAHGSVGATAGAEVALPGGALSLSLEAGASAELAYYYTVDPAGLYAREVALRLPGLPNPFSLGALWEARDKRGFRGARFEFTGNASASVGVALAYSGLGVAIPGVTVDLGAKIAFGATFARSYVLVAEPDGAGLKVSMHRTQLDSHKLAASIGVSVAFPVVAAKVQQVLTKALEKWDAGLEEIKPFLSPGTYLQQQVVGPAIGKAAAKLIGDPKLRAAVVADLQGAFGIDPDDDPDVIQWLTDALHGAIDGQASALLTSVDTAVDGAWKTLSDTIPSFGKPGGDVAEDLRKKIEDAVKAELKTLIGDVQKPFKDALDKVFAGIGDGGTALGKALAKAGAASNKAVKKLDDLTQGVRDALDHYNTLLHDIVKKTIEAAKQKISVSLHADNESSRDLDVQVAGTFGALNDGTSATFRLLALGDLEKIKDIAGGIDKPDDFKLDPAHSSSKLTLLRKGSSGADFLAFGFGASLSMSREARVEVEVDGYGNLQIDMQGNIAARFSGDGQEREVSFADAVSLAMARATGSAAQPTKVELGVSVIYKDKALETSELDAFTRGLGDAGLISADVAAEGLTTLAGWALDKKAPAVDMSAKLWFDGEEAIALLCLGDADREQKGADGTLPPLAATARRRIFDSGWSEFNAVDEIHTKTLKRAMAQFIDDPLDVSDFVFAITEKQIREKINEVSSHQGTETLQGELFYLLQTHNMMHGLIEVIDNASQAYRSTPAGTPTQPGEWSAKDYLDAQDAILTGSRGWLSTGSKFVFWARKGIRPRPLALMRALKVLAKTPDKQVKLTLVDRRVADKPVTVVIAPPKPETD